MNLTWPQVYKNYVVKDEQKPNKIVSLGGIYEAIKKDVDYKFMCSCPRAEVFRYANDGSRWAVYLKPSKGGKKRRALWNKLEAMKLQRTQTGDFEATWVFDADQFDAVASLVKIRKRNNSKGVKNVVQVQLPKVP